MIYLKESVKTNGMAPEILLVVVIANEVYAEQGYECVITSITDGKHGTASLHYIGHAIDLRTRHVAMEVEKQSIVQALKTRLGSQYDVVLEKDHIHIEFQPK